MANSRGPESLKDLVPGELKWLGADMGQHNDEIYVAGSARRRKRSNG